MLSSWSRKLLYKKIKYKNKIKAVNCDREVFIGWSFMTVKLYWQICVFFIFHFSDSSISTRVDLLTPVNKPPLWHKDDTLENLDLGNPSTSGDLWRGKFITAIIKQLISNYCYDHCYTTSGVRQFIIILVSS